MRSRDSCGSRAGSEADGSSATIKKQAPVPHKALFSAPCRAKGHPAQSERFGAGQQVKSSLPKEDMGFQTRKAELLCFNSGSARSLRSNMRQVLIALLGMILGGAAGFGAGVLLGLLFNEVFNISCFEGACGYFVAFMGLVGMVLFAIAGAVILVRMT